MRALSAVAELLVNTGDELKLIHDFRHSFVNPRQTSGPQNGQ